MNIKEPKMAITNPFEKWFCDHEFEKTEYQIPKSVPSSCAGQWLYACPKCGKEKWAEEAE